MKNCIRNLLLVVAGILAGVTLTSGAQAAAARLTATRSNCAVYIDGQRTELTAYMINDENYVRLRDIGAKVDFNVYWDGTVQIESDKPYTGVAPEKPRPSGTVTLPTDGSQYVPKVGDVIPCDDGTLYTIKDVSRWDANMFSEGPLPPSANTDLRLEQLPRRGTARTGGKALSESKRRLPLRPQSL